VQYGQLFSVVKLIGMALGVVMAQFEYIVIDGIIIIALSFVMTLSRPLDELQPQRPTSSLLGHFISELVFESHTKDSSFTKYD
jgi:hypothetical protein